MLVKIQLKLSAEGKCAKLNSGFKMLKDKRADGKEEKDSV